MQKFLILLWLHPRLLSILNCWNRYPRFYTRLPRGVQNLTRKYIGKTFKIFFFKTTMLCLWDYNARIIIEWKFLIVKPWPLTNTRAPEGGSKFNTKVYLENFLIDYIASICEITTQIFSNSVDSELLKPTIGPIL